MKTSLYCVWIALTFFFPVMLSAQKEAKAKEVLDKSSEAFSKAGDMSVYFTINIKDTGAKISESFDGEIRLKNDKFYVSTPEADTWFDGKTQWVYMKGSQEVNVSEPSLNEVQAINPKAIFNMYKNGCNYKFNSEKTDIKNRPVYEVELLPQGKNDISRIVLQINKADYIPVFFHIHYKNKLENLIHINKYNSKQNHPDHLFVFDQKKYPDVEVIDLR